MQLSLQEIMALIGCVKENGLSSFEYRDQDIQISMGNENQSSGKRTSNFSEQAAYAAPQTPVISTPAPQMPVTPAVQPVSQPQEENQPTAEVQPEGKCLTSPIVGTFYAAPAEDAEPFVKVGDHIEKGQVIGIVEAMKLMNEIEAEESGTVAEILVENASVVECGQPLIRII